MDIEKEYRKTYYHTCTLCNKQVDMFDIKNNNAILSVVKKSPIKRLFVHKSCYNKLIKGDDKK